ncbi:MAG: ABC transporter substrate-binding protein [Acetobacteraceae bacterium]|nr:ABC transporter substrate-binding protein [Acetobacteraceae bacterium]
MLSRRQLLGAAAVPLLYDRAFADTPRDAIVMAKRIDDIISLDPQEAFEYSGTEISGNVYEKLVTPDDENPTQIIPTLAESWQASADGKTWTFKMRGDRKFASEAPVTAEDAAFSLQRAVILNKSPGFIIAQLGFDKESVVQRIRATDPRTLVMEIPERQAPTFLLYCLSAAVGGVVEKKVVMSHEQGGDLGNGWLKTNSAGSGPFVIRAARASELVTLDANPNHPRTGNIKRIVIRHTPDPSVQLLLLQRGDADVARDLLPEQLKEARGNPQLTVTPRPKASLMYISINTKHLALAKQEVREAIRWAIDYEGIEGNLVKDTFTVHQAFLPSGFPAALTDNPFRFDPAKAKELLAKAGYADGLELTLDHASSSPRSEIAQALQAQLGQVGIKLTLLAGEGRQVLTKIRARQHQLAISLWGSDYFDPHSNAQTFCENTDNTDGSKNRTSAWQQGWQDQELTAQTQAAVHEEDAGKRVQMYQQMQRELQERGPFAIMLQEVGTVVMRKPAQGLVQGPLSDRTVYARMSKA